MKKRRKRLNTLIAIHLTNQRHLKYFNTSLPSHLYTCIILSSHNTTHLRFIPISRSIYKVKHRAKQDKIIYCNVPASVILIIIIYNIKYERFYICVFCVYL